MRNNELVPGGSWAMLMSLDFKCRDFTKQSDATLFRKENCSSFCVENGLMWGKWQVEAPREGCCSNPLGK